ncbi:MAG TPA: hypothetical protein VGL42_08275 [Opitutaceae bacterium]
MQTQRRITGLRWLSLAAAALVPKCSLCVAAYAGLGALLGLKLGGPEYCGGSPWQWKCWPIRLGAPLIFAGGILLAKFQRHRESKSASPAYNSQGTATPSSGERAFQPARPMANRAA